MAQLPSATTINDATAPHSLFHSHSLSLCLFFSIQTSCKRIVSYGNMLSDLLKVNENERNSPKKMHENWRKSVEHEIRNEKEKTAAAVYRVSECMAIKAAAHHKNNDTHKHTHRMVEMKRWEKKRKKLKLETIKFHEIKLWPRIYIFLEF